MKQKYLNPLIAAALAATALFVPLSRAAVDPAAAVTTFGEISGNVGNIATGRLLEGARVDLPTLGLSVLTDQTGRFVLRNVPAGSHEIVATYLGLDPVTAAVVVSAGQRATRDFDLTAAVYKLQAFAVTGEREHHA